MYGILIMLNWEGGYVGSLAASISPQYNTAYIKSAINKEPSNSVQGYTKPKPPPMHSLSIRGSSITTDKNQQIA
jgi:hypothetical protein